MDCSGWFADVVVGDGNVENELEMGHRTVQYIQVTWSGPSSAVDGAVIPHMWEEHHFEYAQKLPWLKAATILQSSGKTISNQLVILLMMS